MSGGSALLNWPSDHLEDNDRGSVTIKPGDRTPFVSRETERAYLRRLLDSTAVGGAGLALISGELGIGKTRLAEEVAAEGAAREMRVLTGHCREGQGSPAYLPFVEILETVQRQLPANSFRNTGSRNV